MMYAVAITKGSLTPLLRPSALALIGLVVGMGASGCVVESPPPRYWIQNDSSITIILRKPVTNGYTRTTTVLPHDKVEVKSQIAAGGCVLDWEIVDVQGRQLRSIDEVCDGETIVYP